MSDSHVSANMIGMLSAIVSIALKSAGKYKLKYLHKICLITYCEIFDREEKNEIAKFGFQNSASSGGLYPAEDSLGQIYLSKLQIEECSILKAVGIDAAVVDLASSVVKLVDLGHEDSYFNNTSVLHAVHGVKPLDSNFHVASNADANTKLQSLLQSMHLFVITNAVTSTVARNEINHGDRSFSVRLDSLPEPLVALGSYALACALWDITADGSVETTSDSAFPFDLFPYRGRGFAECPPILHTLVAAYFKSSLYSLNDLFNAINTIQLCLTSTKRPSDGKVTTDMVQLSPGVSIHAIGGVRNDNWHGSLLWCNRETLNYSYQLVKHWLHVSNYPSPYAGQISKTDFESNTTSYRVRAHVTGIPKLGINKTGCFISGAAAINSIGDGMKTPVGELMQMKHSVSTMSSVAMFPLRTTNPNVADVAMTADVCSNHLSLPTSFHFYGKGNDEPLVSFDDACFGFGVTVGHAVMPSEKLCAISLSNADLDVSVNLKFSSSNKSHCETLPILHINSSLVHLRDNNDSLRLISTRRWPNARVQAAETLKRSSADRLKYAEEVSAGALSELAIIHRLHYLSDSGQSKHIFCPFGVISAVLPHISKAATPASSGNINNNINNKRERSPNSEELHGLPLSTYPTMVGESMDTVIVDDIDKPAVVKKKRRSFVVPARAQDASVAIDDSESNSALSSGHFDFNVNRNVIISSKQQSFDVTMELYELCGTDKQSKHNSMVYQYLVLPPICMSGADFHRAALHKKVHISSPGLCRLLCYDLMSAISYCSEKDVVFRYLSIDHVSITKEGRLIITDLSGACIIDFSAESGSAKAINHQIPPQYIHTSAPEVLLGGITSDSSSVYCFAQLAILLLLGDLHHDCHARDMPLTVCCCRT